LGDIRFDDGKEYGHTKLTGGILNR